MATESVTITRDEFDTRVQSLAGMMMRKPQLGYLDTLLVEVGHLHPARDVRGRPIQRGQAGLMIEFGFRIQDGQDTLCNGDDPTQDVECVLRQLDGMRIEQIHLEGALPELLLQLDSGWTVRSSSSDELRWCIFFRDEELFPKPHPTPRGYDWWLTTRGPHLILEWACGDNPYTTG